LHGRAQLNKNTLQAGGNFVTDKDAQWSELLKVLAAISRALPQRRLLLTGDAVTEADYLEAGKLYAFHEQAIYDAINAIRTS
jgi:hypothetical protein